MANEHQQQGLPEHRRPYRFRVQWDKCIEGLHLLADRQPGITPFYIAKIFYFADKAHLLDWGRPISGDRYVAMENGPVPSVIYDLIKENYYLADDLITQLDSRLERRGRHFYARYPFAEHALSKTDVEYLETALRLYGHMSFDALSDLSHREVAWRQAWDEPGVNNEIDPFLLIDQEDPNRSGLIEEIRQKTAYAA